jgi:hypothetical protein
MAKLNFPTIACSALGSDGGSCFFTSLRVIRRLYSTLLVLIMYVVHISIDSSSYYLCIYVGS